MAPGGAPAPRAKTNDVELKRSVKQHGPLDKQPAHRGLDEDIRMGVLRRQVLSAGDLDAHRPNSVIRTMTAGDAEGRMAPRAGELRPPGPVGEAKAA